MPATDLPPNPRVAVMGDSSASGLGVHGRESYGSLVAADLGASSTLRVAKSRRLIDETKDIVPRVVQFQPDLVLFGTGMAEGMVQPSRLIDGALARYGPPSWQGPEGLTPRVKVRPANRSSKFDARRKAVTAIKFSVRWTAITCLGGYVRMPPDEYGRELEEVVETLTATGAVVVLVGTSYADPLLFPRTNRSMQPYRLHHERLATEMPLVHLVSPIDFLDPRRHVLADKLHFNAEGHRLVADAVLAQIRTAIDTFDRCPAVSEVGASDGR